MSNKRSRTNYENDAARPPFVFYGTPLPPLDSETRDDGTYVPLWKQEVRDERGRKRLHGAFTGGFSAGYFNTVGSKEGWTPSTFVSSKAQRRKDGNDTPADDAARARQYMDSEDLADLQDSQKLETQDSFAGLGDSDASDRKSNTVLDLFRPTEDTIGTKLLQKMGWRQGQGIGAKVKQLLDDGTIHALAPKDSAMITFNRKIDPFGLGYQSSDRLQQDLDHEGQVDEDEDDDYGTVAKSLAAVRKTHTTKSRRSGIGVGVLNDNGSDDEDPYELGPKISYNKIIGGVKKKKRTGGLEAFGSVNGNRSNFRTPKVIGTSARITSSGRCHDGRLPLEGFILSSRPTAKDQSKDYAPPEVPLGWQPSRQKETDPSNQPMQSTAEAAKASTLDPAQRSAILGEATLPGKSVFDYMTPEQRAKLVAVTGRTDLPPAKGERAPEGYIDPRTEQSRRMAALIPHLDKSIALEALARASAGWLPYAEDPDKRSRYKAFIDSSAGKTTTLPPRPSASSTTETWTTELTEFVKAAHVFRPVSGLMASRFTTSSATPSSSRSHDNKTTADTSAADSTKGTADQKLDPALEAAKMDMYGPLTRTSEQWFPTRLACKRFGVRVPDHVMHGVETGTEGARAGNSSSSWSATATAAAAPAAATATGAAAGSSRATDSDTGAGVSASSGFVSKFVSGGLETVGNEEHAISQGIEATANDTDRAGVRPTVDAEVNEAIESQRAGEEIFKAIFGDSDDE